MFWQVVFGDEVVSLPQEVTQNSRREYSTIRASLVKGTILHWDFQLFKLLFAPRADIFVSSDISSCISGCPPD